MGFAFFAVDPHRRIATLKQVIVDLGDAADAGSALAAYTGLEVGHFRLFHRDRGSSPTKIRR